MSKKQHRPVKSSGRLTGVRDRIHARGNGISPLPFLFCGKAAIESDRIGLTKWRPDRVEAFRKVFNTRIYPDVGDIDRGGEIDGDTLPICSVETEKGAKRARIR